MWLREKTRSNTSFNVNLVLLVMTSQVIYMSVKYDTPSRFSEINSNQATDLRQKTELLLRKVIKYFTLKYFISEPKPAARRQKIGGGGGGAPMPRSRRRRRVEKIGGAGAARPAQGSSTNT